MANLQFEDFCQKVCQMLRWKAARGPVSAELTAHLEDHAAALEARGLSPEEAAAQAVTAMGNPYALGHALDQTHPPTLPRVSRLFLAVGLLALFLGILLGLNRDSGLFALAGVVPQPPELSYDTGDSLVLKGAAAGGGVLGAYTFASAGRAGLVHVRWELSSGVKEEYQLQVPLTVTARRPWLPVPLVYAADASYTDDAGGSGPCSLRSGEDYLLGASGPLRYENGVWFGKADAWAVRRAGDSFTLMELERTAGLLWRSEAIMDITPSRWGEAIWAFPAGLDYYDVFQEGSLDSETWSEFTPVAVSDDPRVAQVEVTAVWVGDEERDAPAAALAERGVTAWLSPAGDGVWSGPSLSIRFYSPGAASRSSILLLSCRGYDTDGELVAFCD